MTKWFQMGFQDPATTIMANLVNLYDLALTICVLVVTFVFLGLGGLLCSRGYSARTILNADSLEIAWTAIPATILFGLAVPSTYLLYLMDEVVDPEVTVKAIGRQWYWTYEYGDFGGFEVDSYMVREEESLSSLRLLEVDYRALLPVNTRIRMLISSDDVIHSWAVPQLGVKVDGVPGRMNQVGLFIPNTGVYRGMCSELCGVNHAFMPIVIEAVPFDKFLSWAKEMALEWERDTQ